MNEDLSRESRDIELFDSIASHYSEKDKLPASRVARRARLLQSLRRIELSEAVSILELGCGAGWSAEYLDGIYTEFCGVDYSASLIDHAKAENSRQNAEFRVGNIKQLDIGKKYDVVLMVGVLHHVDDMPAALCNACNALKPGGWLVVNEPQGGNPFIQIARWLRKRLDSSYSADQINFRRGEIERLLLGAKLQSVATYPQGYLSTPFAEVALPLQALAKVTSKFACRLDRILESSMPRSPLLSWNIVAVGQKEC